MSSIPVYLVFVHESEAIVTARSRSDAEATICGRDASSLVDSVIRIRCLQQREPSFDRCVGVLDTSIAPPTLTKEFAVAGRAHIGAEQFAVAKSGGAGYPRHIATVRGSGDSLHL